MIETGVKQERTDRQLLDRERSGVCQGLFSIDMCSPLPPRHERVQNWLTFYIISKQRNLLTYLYKQVFYSAF